MKDKFYRKTMKKHIVSFSGGKNSTAMLLMILDRGMYIDDIVFADTKYEFLEMYQHIDNVEKFIDRPIIRLRTKDNLEDWMYGRSTRGKSKGKVRGFPLKGFPCYWSRQSKFIVLDKYCKGHIRYIGITIDELHRAKNKDGYLYPLVSWGINDEMCIEYLKGKDLYPPILRKFKSTGCWWCQKQSLDSLRVLYKEYPDYWKQLRHWDDTTPGSFRPDYTVRELEDKFNKE